MELIDKQELIRWFMGSKYEFGTNRVLLLDTVIGDIALTPTIDAVPVTRCKDCLFAEAQIGGEVWCNAHLAVFKADGFCDSGRPQTVGKAVKQYAVD